MSTPHRIVVAGSVSSTERTLTALLRHEAPVVGVLGLAPEASPNVSDYIDLGPSAEKEGIPYLAFRSINSPEVLAQVRAWQPTLLFAVGLSQLLGDDLLRVPELGCVGFHPTRLPQGRGRAALAWLTMAKFPGAASFFLMDAGADSGPILVQAPFEIDPEGNAQEVLQALRAAIDSALDSWVPRLLAGEWRPLPQDGSLASYAGRRAPLDGIVDWSQSADDIHALVRAASHPHPGAFTYYKDWTVRIWRSARYAGPKWVGVPGRILGVDAERGWLVHCGDAPLWILELDLVGPKGRRARAEEVLRVGVKLGYVVEHEIHELRLQMEAVLDQLEAISQARNPSRREA